MEMYTLFTYRGLEELRNIQSECEVYPFAFGDTKDLLELDPNVCIDITTLVYYLQINKNDIYAVQVNFEEVTIDTILIIKSSMAETAIELLPLLFYEYKEYYTIGIDEESESLTLPDISSCHRRVIYKYNSTNDLDKIIHYTSSNDIPIAAFSRANGELHKEFEQFNKAAELALIDLTSLSYAIEDNKTLIYAVEQLLAAFPNISIVVQASQVDVLFKYFPLFFESQEPICKLIPALPDMGEGQPEINQIIKITDLSKIDMTNFVEEFNYNLIGHNYFKNRLQHALKNFIPLNKAKEQKVLSVFLFGASGIGKTEVARLLANGLKENSYLAKISFQNYSSQDALNSLIGSPSGYIGCDHGELSEKVKKSKVAVLLCDEFEKATRPVFSFFLELLEEGHFTDSMAREYDMDGYIIIFTSNILNEAEYKKTIPQELQTRFDLVCEFEEPTLEEKIEFLDLLLEKAQSQYHEQFSHFQMTESDKEELYDLDYSGLSALRDIKRVFNNRLMDLFDKKECNI